jgi:hypothetical protein
MKYSVRLYFSYGIIRTKENSAMIFFSDDEDYLTFDDRSSTQVRLSSFFELSSSIHLLEQFLELL